MKLLTLATTCTTILTHWSNSTTQWDFSRMKLGAPSTYTLPSGEVDTLAIRGGKCKGYIELSTETLLYEVQGNTLSLCDKHKCETYEPINERKPNKRSK